MITSTVASSEPVNPVEIISNGRLIPRFIWVTQSLKLSFSHNSPEASDFPTADPASMKMYVIKAILRHSQMFLVPNERCNCSSSELKLHFRRSQSKWFSLRTYYRGLHGTFYLELSIENCSPSSDCLRLKLWVFESSSSEVGTFKKLPQQWKV